METTITHLDRNGHHDDKQQGESVSLETSSSNKSSTDMVKGGDVASSGSVRARPEKAAPKDMGQKKTGKRDDSKSNVGISHKSKAANVNQKKGTSSGGDSNTRAGQKVENSLGDSDATTTSVIGQAVIGQVVKHSGEHKNGQLAPRDPVDVNLRALLEAGVHYGHQTSRWNPAMAPYIHSVKNGIHIINLPKTIQCWQQAKQVIKDIAANGGSVLFVGTKKQAQEAVVEEATRSGSFFVSRRWLGGMLTNFQTIRKSIERMKKIEEQIAEEELAIKNHVAHKFTKKERLLMSRELEKLHFSLGGIQEMYSVPQLLFIVDIKCEEIAVKEASRLDIPVIALIDTNCDPRRVTYPIPANDDGTRSVRLFCQAVSDAIIEGRKLFVQKGGVHREAVRRTVAETVKNSDTQEPQEANPVVHVESTQESTVI